MRKQIVTAFTIGSLALSTVTAVSAAQAADTGTPTVTTSLAQHQISRKQRNNARINELADILGITQDQLVAELKAGKKPLQIAKAHGITEAQLKEKMAAHRAAVIENVKKELAAEVAAGTITQAQMDARIKTITAHSQKHQGWNRRHFGV